MSEKYYREINSNKDIVKFKLQLGAILLKLNEHNSNISNIKDNITKLNTDIKNNDNDIKSNYDMCVNNSSSIRDVDRKIYATNNNIKNINSDIESIKESNKNIIKHNYAIDDIWFFNIDIINTYTIESSKVTLFEYIIEGKFITNSVLEISCNILYKYANYNDVGLLKHIYSLLDANDNVIHVHNIIHTNSGDNLKNDLTMNDDFSILFKNSHTSKLKIRLQLGKVDVSKNKTVGLRILNPYNNNILRVKHIKYIS